MKALYQVTSILSLAIIAGVYFSDRSATLVHVAMLVYALPYVVNVLGEPLVRDEEGEDKPKSWCD